MRFVSVLVAAVVLLLAPAPAAHACCGPGPGSQIYSCGNLFDRFCGF